MKIEEKDEDGKDVKEQKDVWGWEGRMRMARIDEDGKDRWGWIWMMKDRQDRWIWILNNELDGYEWWRMDGILIS